MLPKSFAYSDDDDDESGSSIPVDDCEPNLIGPRDSPISINEYASTRIELPNLVWHGYSNFPQSLIVFNTGESVQITGEWGRGKPYVTGGPLNGSYMFSQIHFHMPSEHSLNEKRYPLEMHAVHYKSSYLTQKRAMKKNDGTVVVVYFFEIGGQCPTNMSKLTQVLSRIKHKNCSVEICNSNLEDYMKMFCSNYFIYWGTAEVGESNYSLQWLISCRRLVISEREYCELEYFFREASCGKMKRSTRDAKPNLAELYLVGDTVVRTYSEGHRSEVRFSENGRSGETSEKSKSCCLLSKPWSYSSNSRDKDSCDGKIRQIFPKTKESHCSRCINKSLRNRSTGISQSPEKCSADKQTSTGSVCKCSFPGKCRENSRSRSRSSVSSRNDTEIESSPSCKGKRTSRTCDRKVGAHNCIENECKRNTFRIDDLPRKAFGNICNKAKKSYVKCKRRIRAKEDSSSDNESTERSTCTATCEVVKSTNDGQDIFECDVVCSNSDVKSSGPEKNEKQPKNKDGERSVSKDNKTKAAKPKKKKKTEKTSRAGADDTDSDKSAEKKEKPLETWITKLNEKEANTESSRAKLNNAEGKAEQLKTIAKEKKEANVGEIKREKIAGETEAGIATVEENSKQMGQHKPVILAQATIDDNTFILKSVGTMTASLSHPGHSEDKNLAEELCSTEESISNTEIWKKERQSEVPKTLNKIVDIPETLEKDQESNSAQAEDKKSKEPEEANKEEAGNVAVEQSLFSMLEKMSNDPSLNNFLKRFADPENQQGESGKEQSIGSILAKISKDSSLACMLSKISREVLSKGRSGSKIEKAGPNLERATKVSSTSSDVGKAESDSDVLIEIYGKTPEAQGNVPTSTDEEGMTDSGYPQDQALSVILNGSSRDHGAVSGNVSIHSSPSSKFSVSPKEPILTGASIQTTEGAEKETEEVACPKNSLIRESISAGIQPEPVMAGANSKPSLTSSTKERSLVRVLMRVSQEPLLAVELANLLKPLPEGQSRSKEESLGNVLSKLSQEPSLAADLANVLGEQHSNASVDPKTSSLIKAVKSSKEKSLANILVAVSRKTSMIPGGSKDNSFADIVRKISREPSVVCDVANVLNRDSQYSGSDRLKEELLASVSVELAEGTAKNRSSGNFSKRDSRGSNQFREAKERSSSIISTQISKKASLGLRTRTLRESAERFRNEGPKKEQSHAVILDKVSKESSSPRDFANTPKMGSSSFDSEKSVKQGTKSKASADSSHGNRITNDLQSETVHAAEKDEPPVADQTKSPKNQSLASLLGKISGKPANFLKKKSFSGTFPRSKEEKLMSDSAKSSKTQPLLDISDTGPHPNGSIVQGFKVETSPSTTADPILAEDANQHTRDRSLVNILDKVSRNPSFANDLAVVLKSSPRECCSVKGSKTSKHSREKDPAGSGGGNVEESTAEILVAMTKAPSGALDLSKYSQDQSLVSILYKVSKKPSLVSNLANVLHHESSNCLIIHSENSPCALSGCDVKTSPKPTTDEIKATKEESLVKILMEVSKEPTLGTYLAKILRRNSRIIESGKGSPKEESLANILSKVSAQPSLAHDLANIFIGESQARDLEKSMRDESFPQDSEASISPGETKTYSKDELPINLSDKVSNELPITLEPAEIPKENSVDSETLEKEHLPEGPTANNEPEESEIPVKHLLVSEEIAATAQEVLSRKILSEVSETRKKSVPEVVEETSVASPIDPAVKSLTDMLLKLSRESSLITDIVNSLKAASAKKLAENHMVSSSAPGLGKSKLEKSETDLLVGLPKKLSLESNLPGAVERETPTVLALPESVRKKLEQSDIKALSSVTGEKSTSSDSTGNLIPASKVISEETSEVSESLQMSRQPEPNESGADSETNRTSDWESGTVPQEGSREIERIRVNFEAEPNQYGVGSERPEAEKLHRQEDLNESIKSRRSTETRKSGDDESSIDSNKKKAPIGSERSHLSVVQSKAGSSDTSTQSFFEEYYVKIQNENSVIQEYTGKLESSEITPGNTVKLKLFPKGSVAIDDINMEMEECLIRFDSKSKTGDLYVEANFLVGRKGSPSRVNPATDQPGRSLSVRALKITGSAQSEISENSLSGKKPLYFVSEGIEVDPETGKKVVIGKFVKDRNW